MRDEKKAETRTTPNPRKLLRVLVAGGMALAGVTAARAEEKPAPPAERGAQPAKSDEDKAREKEREKEKSAEKAKKKADKKADDDSSGVKGW